jgi:hypothetical protein
MKDSLAAHKIIELKKAVGVHKEISLRGLWRHGVRREDIAGVFIHYKYLSKYCFFCKTWYN